MEQPWRLADALVTLGYAAVDRTCYERAQTLLEEGLTLYTRNGAQTEIALCLEAFAALAGGTRQPERAVRLWGAAAALRETLGYPLAPTEQVHHDRRVAAVRAQLDEATWQQAWTEGRAMPLDQAIAYALEDEAEAGVVN